jgi:hypothetical protein
MLKFFMSVLKLNSVGFGMLCLMATASLATAKSDVVPSSKGMATIESGRWQDVPQPQTALMPSPAMQLAQVPIPGDLAISASPTAAPADTTSDLKSASVPANPMAQVTSVSQLSDVRPTDWAFQALQSLVERYGCIAGYPDKTYRGNRAMTRYEFAAGLNACLDRVNELIAAGTADLVKKEDLATLQKLQEEFAAELATLRGRVDALEARTATLEKQQFSTTTRLNAEVVFAAAGVFGDRAADRDANPNNNPDLQDNLIFGDRVRLNFDTSFVGNDRLRVRLQARNITPFAGTVTGTNMTRLSIDSSNGNQFDIDYIYYRFRPTPKTTVVVSAFGTEYSDIMYTINPYLEGSGDGSISRFGRYSPIYRGFGAGAIVEQKFSDSLHLTLGYLAGDAANPANKNGLFNGNYAALAQVLFKPTKNLDLGLVYSHAYFPGGGTTGVNTTFSTGSLAARRPFGNVSTSTDSIQLGASFRITPKVVVSGWFDYIFADSEVNNNDAEIVNFTANVVFLDLGKKGNMGAIIFGMPPKVIRNTIAANEDPDTSFHIEALYRYQINKHIAVTPGVIVITNPEHNNNNDTIVVGVIRTTFKF